MTDRAKLWVPTIVALLIALGGRILVPSVRTGKLFGYGYELWLMLNAFVPIAAGVAGVACALLLQTSRAERVWIPGTSALVITSIGGALVVRALVPPPTRFYWFGPYLGVRVGALLVLAVAGAAGAALSWLSGGSKQQRACAAEFRAFYGCLVVLVDVAKTLASFLEQSVQWHIMWHVVGGVAVRTITLEVVLPATMLLLGASPFLVSKQHRPEVVSP